MKEKKGCFKGCLHTIGSSTGITFFILILILGIASMIPILKSGSGNFFADYINGYRIEVNEEELIKFPLDQNQLPISRSILEEAGYSFFDENGKISIDLIKNNESACLQDFALTDIQLGVLLNNLLQGITMEDELFKLSLLQLSISDETKIETSIDSEGKPIETIHLLHRLQPILKLDMKQYKEKIKNSLMDLILPDFLYVSLSFYFEEIEEVYKNVDFSTYIHNFSSDINLVIVELLDSQLSENNETSLLDELKKNIDSILNGTTEAPGLKQWLKISRLQFENDKLNFIK